LIGLMARKLDVDEYVHESEIDSGQDQALLKVERAIISSLISNTHVRKFSNPECILPLSEILQCVSTNSRLIYLNCGKYQGEVLKINLSLEKNRLSFLKECRLELLKKLHSLGLLKSVEVNTLWEIAKMGVELSWLNCE
jgi:hypothetical protein